MVLHLTIRIANLLVASTYKPLIDLLAVPVQKAGVLNLSTPITSVTTTDPLVPGQKRMLLTSTDRNFSVDSLIVTAPLGCLKKNTIKFNPPLPERIQQSISSLSYGQLEKVYICFPRAYWAEHKEGRMHIFLAPEYAPETNPHRWHMACFSYAHLPEPCDQPTLLFYLFGPVSQHLTSPSFKSADTEEGLRQYTEFFEPYFSRLSGYDPESGDCKPKRIVSTNWSNDEYAGFGSYTNFQVGLEDGLADLETLRNGMPDRGVWIAGEHSAPVLGLGSVSGAYWSGERAAEQVIESFEGAGRNASSTAAGALDGTMGAKKSGAEEYWPCLY